MDLAAQFAWLLILGMPVASISWTVTHEEIFRELREFVERRSSRADSGTGRKIHYLITCEYCFSHWVSAGIVALAGFKVLLDDWRGYVVAAFALVWIANIYMTIYARLRVTLKKDRVEAEIKEQEHSNR